jgi:photosystem II stability/assembly factor-like uncharacterized protein
LSSSCSKQAPPSTFGSTIELVGYQAGNIFEIRYPTGEVAASLSSEDALFQFPAGQSDESSDSSEGLKTFYGQGSAGLRWAVVCSGSSLGNMQANILLSQDYGKSFQRIGDADEYTRAVITGAGFLSAECGFLCYRYTNTNGPEIYMTNNGGEDWEFLEITVPEAYSSCKMMPRSPVITERSVCFPVDLYNESGLIGTVYCSSTNLDEWNWTT